MTTLTAFYFGMATVFLIESLLPSPGRIHSFVAACLGVVLIILLTVRA